MQLWRLTRRKHAHKESLSEGARRSGGRWNREGTPVVYTGTSISLVALEYFVHLSGQAPRDLVLLRLELRGRFVVEEIGSARLVEEWNRLETETQELGTSWARSARSIGLSVPSAIVPEERNVVLNPSHRSWRHVRLEVARDFTFDPRMYKAP